MKGWFDFHVKNKRRRYTLKLRRGKGKTLKRESGGPSVEEVR